MKIFSKYMFVALTACFALASCSDDDDYAPGPQDTEDRAGVYFPSTNETSLELDPDDPTTETVIQIARLNTSGELEVPIIVQTNENETFTVPETVTFADGESTANITVGFQTEEVGTSYQLVITVPTEYISLYKEFDGGVSQTLSIQRVKWNAAGSGTFYDALYAVSGTVDVQQADGTNTYRFVAPLSNILEQNGYGRPGEVNFTFTMTSDGTVSVEAGTYDFEVGTDYYTDEGGAYQLYYYPDDYSSYCNITNDNGTITWNFLYLYNGSDLYVGGMFTFEWTDGYPLAE